MGQSLAPAVFQHCLPSLPCIWLHCNAFASSLFNFDPKPELFVVHAIMTQSQLVCSFQSQGVSKILRACRRLHPLKRKDLSAFFWKASNPDIGRPTGCWCWRIGVSRLSGGHPSSLSNGWHNGGVGNQPPILPFLPVHPSPACNSNQKRIPIQCLEQNFGHKG